ncbi:MAG: YggS family pyridoxal phosphate-dependent enzyme [Proteobacteria bacterium]|nr:YggS family pyridoxal phosphate-dependent enzyme [Pseudomonadota bacterium]
MSQLEENLVNVRSSITEAAQKSGRRPDDVRLVAVSKTMGAEKVAEVLRSGQTLFGENKVQEAREKIPLVGGDAEWHMIGRLQKNKAKYIPGLFTTVHSVDSFELAEALNLAMANALERGKGLKSEILHILIQVNIAMEESKGGATETELINLIKKISILSHLKIKGLMIIPPYSENTEETRAYFKKLRQLRDKIAVMKLPNVDMEELSMGMSHDFEVAIEEGATLVRVGSAIFGERNTA